MKLWNWNCITLYKCWKAVRKGIENWPGSRPKLDNCLSLSVLITTTTCTTRSMLLYKYHPNQPYVSMPHAVATFCSTVLGNKTSDKLKLYHNTVLLYLFGAKMSNMVINYCSGWPGTYQFFSKSNSIYSRFSMIKYTRSLIRCNSIYNFVRCDSISSSGMSVSGTLVMESNEIKSTKSLLQIIISWWLNMNK